MNRYYEIIGPYTGEVIGVCCYPADGGEDTCTFGRISKKDFDRFGDNSWSVPISKKRYILKTVKVLVKLK